MYGAGADVAGGARMNSYKSRGANVTSPTALQSGDYLRTDYTYGHDGTGFIETSSILHQTEGTIATNRIGSNIQFWTHPDSTSANREVMRIAASGNVGIGTIAPTRKLTVHGGGLQMGIDGGTYSGNGEDLGIYLTNPNANAGSPTLLHTGGRIYSKNSSTGGWENQLLVLEAPTSWNTWNANQLVLSGAGNVGIGTTSPDYKLDLGGGNIKMGYTRTAEVSAACAANSQGGATATCPAGTKVIGGGCRTNWWKTVVAGSYATSDTTWYCLASNLDGAASTVYSSAICANIK